MLYLSNNVFTQYHLSAISSQAVLKFTSKISKKYKVSEDIVVTKVGFS